MLGVRFCISSVTTQIFRRSTFSTGYAVNSSSNAAAVETAPSSSSNSQTASENAEKDTKYSANQEGENVKKAKYSLVAAAFESLRDDPTFNMLTKTTASSNGNIGERINNAKTINSLLSVAEGNSQLTRQHALKIVSILAEWSTANHVKLPEFENDPRFLKVCRMLGRNIKSENVGSSNKVSNQISGFRTDDLNTVLGIAGEDEAAKLIARISLPQMVKVMSALATRKRRSTPLLRSLAFNISSATETLDLKQCSDIFFAMATLNFQDSVLSAKVCADVQTVLPKNTNKSAVVGSILTSLGILKYRDLDILECLTQWILKYSEVCRLQDISALFLTSAILSFKSANIEEIRQKFQKTIVQQEFSKNVDWLNYVWSLAMLDMCDNIQLESVLSQTFVDKLQLDKGGLTTTSKMKLLNLNNYAKLMAKGYKGPIIANNNAVYDVPMAHTKSKQLLVDGLIDTLKSLLPANNHVKSLVDSKMGFLIDAICVFDAKRNPLPLHKEQANSIKVALMVVDFHDICHGTHKSTSGITALSYGLLEKSGYKVVPVPYNEFSNSDKLLKRVQYLERKFKELISANTK